MNPTLLIVDDDEAIRTQMKWALAQHYHVVLAENRFDALEKFRLNGPAVTILDLGLPPSPTEPDEGMKALSEMLLLERTAKIIIISGQGERENAVRAVGAGACDFFCKPVDFDELRLLLRRYSYTAELERGYREQQRNEEAEAFEGMLGKSPEMQKVFASISKVASSSASVLLLGESGTGKEMAALAIHRRSARKAGPFVALNCNAIPENLLESELFGHEKGAFTGAHVQRRGLIETAASGTLFLDEIGELPCSVQVKLLRFLQERCFQRVGGRQEIKVETRTIAATNADLERSIANGTFREDLFFRLAVVVINLPSLQQRGEDITLLAKAFLERFADKNGKGSLTFAPETLRAIGQYHWPGNIRELQNRIQRAVIMADGKRIILRDMELDSATNGPTVTTLKEARETTEREMIVQALKKHAGKISSAASELGISRPTLYELMEKLGIVRQ